MAETQMVAQQHSLMTVIEQVAANPNVDIDKLYRLLEMQERWEANEARKSFNAALVRFKANPPQIFKNSKVNFGSTKYNYASLDNVNAQILVGLSAVDIAHRWTTQQTPEAVTVTCVLTHKEGHSESVTMVGPVDKSGSKNAIQGIGSSISYLQRYTLLAATGLATGEMDNDGRGAEPEAEQRQAGMDDNALKAAIDSMAKATTLEEAKGMFRESYKLANSLKDTEAMKTLTTVWETRKKDFGASNAA